MALPAIISGHLLPQGALAPAAAAAGPPPGGAPTGGAGANMLPFTMHPQEQANWCWSAVGVSVAQFYIPATPWTSQCYLASQELGLTCCPTGMNNGACDVPWYLERSLTRVGHYNTIGFGSLGIGAIRAEIDAARPLGVRIQWSGTGGHFVVVSGYSVGAGGTFVTIEDPIYGQSTLTLSAFSTSYQGSGSWSHSYWTH
jgi:hypothetical protein